MTRYQLARLALAGTLAACSSPSAESDSRPGSGTTIEAGQESDAVVVNSDEDVVITGDKTVQQRACTGQDVQVVGSGNQATFTGTCADVSIMGEGNQVSLENVASIQVVGSNNTVTWRGAKPEVTDVGTNNRVTEAR